MSASTITGSLSWWRYLLAPILICITTFVFSVIIEDYWHSYPLNIMGTELMTVVGASVGMAIGFEVAALTLVLLGALELLIPNASTQTIPVAIAAFIALGRRYGREFLFTKSTKYLPLSCSQGQIENSDEIKNKENPKNG